MNKLFIILLLQFYLYSSLLAQYTVAVISQSESCDSLSDLICVELSQLDQLTVLDRTYTRTLLKEQERNLLNLDAQNIIRTGEINRVDIFAVISADHLSKIPRNLTVFDAHNGVILSQFLYSGTDIDDNIQQSNATVQRALQKKIAYSRDELISVSELKITNADLPYGYLSEHGHLLKAELQKNLLNHPRIALLERRSLAAVTKENSLTMGKSIANLNSSNVLLELEFCQSSGIDRVLVNIYGENSMGKRLFKVSADCSLKDPSSSASEIYKDMLNKLQVTQAVYQEMNNSDEGTYYYSQYEYYRSRGYTDKAMECLETAYALFPKKYKDMTQKEVSSLPSEVRDSVSFGSRIAGELVNERCRKAQALYKVDKIGPCLELIESTLDTLGNDLFTLEIGTSSIEYFHEFIIKNKSRAYKRHHSRIKSLINRIYSSKDSAYSQQWLGVSDPFLFEVKDVKNAFKLNYYLGERYDILRKELSAGDTKRFDYQIALLDKWIQTKPEILNEYFRMTERDVCKGLYSLHAQVDRNQSKAEKYGDKILAFYRRAQNKGVVGLTLVCKRLEYELLQDLQHYKKRDPAILNKYYDACKVMLQNSSKLSHKAKEFIFLSYTGRPEVVSGFELKTYKIEYNHFMQELLQLFTKHESSLLLQVYFYYLEHYKYAECSDEFKTSIAKKILDLYRAKKISLGYSDSIQKNNVGQLNKILGIHVLDVKQKVVEKAETKKIEATSYTTVALLKTDKYNSLRFNYFAVSGPDIYAFESNIQGTKQVGQNLSLIKFSGTVSNKRLEGKPWTLRLGTKIKSVTLGTQNYYVSTDEGLLAFPLNCGKPYLLSSDDFSKKINTMVEVGNKLFMSFVLPPRRSLIGIYDLSLKKLKVVASTEKGSQSPFSHLKRPLSVTWLESDNARGRVLVNLNIRVGSRDSNLAGIWEYKFASGLWKQLLPGHFYSRINRLSEDYCLIDDNAYLGLLHLKTDTLKLMHAFNIVLNFDDLVASGKVNYSTLCSQNITEAKPEKTGNRFTNVMASKSLKSKWDDKLFVPFAPSMSQMYGRHSSHGFAGTTADQPASLCLDGNSLISTSGKKIYELDLTTGVLKVNEAFLTGELANWQSFVSRPGTVIHVSNKGIYKSISRFSKSSISDFVKEITLP